MSEEIFAIAPKQEHQKQVKRLWRTFRNDFDLIDYIQAYGDPRFQIPDIPEEENKDEYARGNGQLSRARSRLLSRGSTRQGRDLETKFELFQKRLTAFSNDSVMQNLVEEEFEELVQWFIDIEERTKRQFDAAGQIPF